MPGSLDYHSWQQDVARVNGTAYRFATKPGLLAHGVGDPASQMLAEQARIAPGDVVVQLNCGSGLLGAVALAAGASRVLLADRNVLSYEAARRTMATAGALPGDASHAVFLSQGLAGVPPAIVAGVRATLVAIRIPHERLTMLQLLADAFAMMDIGGVCMIGGGVHEGIKPAVRAMQAVFGNAKTVAQGSGHHVSQAVKQHSAPADAEILMEPLLAHAQFRLLTVQLRDMPLTLHTRPGVFSWEHADEATTLLAAHMQLPAGASALDLGCGAGGIGITAARVAGGPLCMIDADSEAVRCAMRSARDAGVHGVRVLPSDIVSAVRDERFDVVLSNPPFHVGKATELAVPAQFIADAYRVLEPGGTLQLVANRTLPYEGLLQAAFGNVTSLHDGARFKVLWSEKRTAS